MIKIWLEWIERCVLLIIAGYACLAIYEEVYHAYLTFTFELKDMLILFIYAEVLSMVASFFSSHAIPIKIPLLIALTSICRLIILQKSEENEALNLIYESASIFILVISYLAIGLVKDSTNKE